MNPYNVDTSDSNIRGPLISLKVLYEGMPSTSGCENCAQINGEEAFWCCKTTNPSMYYVEFLYAWEKVQNWSKTKRIDLVVRCIENYLQNAPNKGCVFYVNGCTIYNERPFNCRVYGVIPAEGWEERINMGKKRFGDDYNPRPQCTLVTASVPITKIQEDKWFRHTRDCEKRIGVDVGVVQAHDDAHGSYRTFHDHILIELFKPEFLNSLTQLRLSNPSKDAIDAFVKILRDTLEK